MEIVKNSTPIINSTSDNNAFRFDYQNIQEQTSILNSTEEKILFLKDLLHNLDEFYSSQKASAAASPKDKISYFEKVNVKKLIRTKIFLEELKKSPGIIEY